MENTKYAEIYTRHGRGRPRQRVTLKKYTWEEIREGYKILKRYDISWQEMEELNGMIFYPPTEAMRHIRQYPPFGQ
ncbi:MAG: hypothetical protein FWD02_06585 [Bacteroidales bacterium]|nr:hypothetical protein [Bacteroidales bacterium]